jgi:hypothetical protein
METHFLLSFDATKPVVFDPAKGSAALIYLKGFFTP